MSSPAQILANRANALKSTGPRTPEGKDASRRNALTHGLTAEIVGLPDVEVAARVEEWSGVFRPGDGRESWLVGQAAVSSVQVERCQAVEKALTDRHADRALYCWEMDRMAEAERLATRLPKAPALVARELARTSQGISWMLGRWESLGRLLETGGDWDEAHQGLALDLLGVPHEFRAGPTEIDGDLDARKALVRGQAERLRGWIADGFDEMDRRERAYAEKGHCLSPDADLRLVRRYEASWFRRQAWALDQLQKHRKADADSCPESVAEVLATRTRTRTLARVEAEPARPARMPAIPVEVRAEIPPPPEPTPAVEPARAARPASPLENRRTRRARKALARRG